MDLSFEKRAVGGKTVLAVSGDVDLHTAPQLRDRIRTLVDEGARALVIDMTGVEFLDSTGLGTLLGSRKQLVALDGRLALAGLSDHVLKVFEITSLDQVFDIHPTVDAALRGIDNDTPAGEPAWAGWALVSRLLSGHRDRVVDLEQPHTCWCGAVLVPGARGGS